MKKFFANTRPGKEITYGDTTFELPILYSLDDFFLLYFTADATKVKAIMPSDNLYPVILPTGRAIIGIAAYNYVQTTVGTYGEVPVAIPAVYGEKLSPVKGILPVLMESLYPGFGVLVMHLPVTKILARDAGRGEWGYTKFIADMHFDITPEYMECRMHEEDQHILDIRVARRGFYLRDTKPLITFSVKDNNLIKTVIPHKGVKRMSLNTRGSFLKLGDHPMAQSVKDLGISSKPFMAAYYAERAAILPEGKVIEENVSPFEGYIGKNRDAKHTVHYAGQLKCEVPKV